MATRQSISVSLTAKQAEFLAACVASGRYQSTSEVVREAVRLLEDSLARRRAELDHVRNAVREGADQLDRGDIVEGETFFREWDAELGEIEIRERRKIE